MAIIQDELNYKAPKMKPITTEVDAGTETVESRMNNMNLKDSAYTTLNRKEAQRSSANRGLINSTMAGAAGVEAGIKASLPIAQQDAKTYTDTRFKNQDVQNDFLKNRQSANLNKETASHTSGLTRGEMSLGSDLKKSEMSLGSDLTKGEMTLGSDLTKGEMTLGSALTNEENKLLTDLEMKRDAGLSQLTREEETLLNELGMKRDAFQSGLTREENAQLNALEMKRDAGLSELTREENALLNELEMKRDVALSEQRIEEATVQNQLDIQRDTNTTELNKSLAAFESDLKKSEMQLDATLKARLEGIINSAKTSEEAKIDIIRTMNQLVRDTEQQITEISLSDRTAPQQAEAIERARANRDANLAMFSKTLEGMQDLDWTGIDLGGTETVQTGEPNTQPVTPSGPQPVTQPVTQPSSISYNPTENYTPPPAPAPAPAPVNQNGSVVAPYAQNDIRSDPNFIAHGDSGWKDYYKSLSRVDQAKYNQTRGTYWDGGNNRANSGDGPAGR